MSFLAPLAFAFAASIPVVIVFYLLKRKRVVKLVSSTLLWQKFLADTQASAPFQKLRKNWLLYLQILLLALAVLALTRPFFATTAKPAQLRVVILDGSASMQAVDESPSRFERARTEALKWVDSLEPSDQMVVLLAGANTEVKQSATSEKAALRRALQACAPSDSPTRLVPALKMAESLVRDRHSAEIHLFSDGAVPELSDFENKALPLIYHKVGQRADNLGITALDARANPEDATQRAVFVNVANVSSNTMNADLELLFDGQLVNTVSLTVPGGESKPHAFKATQAKDGVFTVRLTGKDDLAADNEASIVSLLPKPVNVLLVTRGNRLLEKALRAVANVHLAVANDLTDAGAGFDFIVLDGVVPTAWPKGNVLAFRTVNTNWVESVAAVEAPVIVDWKSTHPLLRYAGFDNVQIVQSLTARAPTWAVSILEAPQAPLILAGDLGRQRIVWVGFDPLESNWPLRVSFPIFIANAVDWLNPANAKNSQLLIKAGDPFRLALAEPVKSAEVKLPDGKTTTLNVEGANEIVFGDTAKQGIYHLRAGTNEVTFCADLLDSAESNIRPRDELKFGEYTRVTATTVQRTNMELWRTLAAIGLAVLLFEMVVVSQEDGVTEKPDQPKKDRSWRDDEFARHEVFTQWWWFIIPVIGLFVAILIPNIVRIKSKGSSIVTVYAAQDQVYAEPILREFEKEAGIKVKAVYDSEAVKTVGLANRLLAERSHPQCDVFWGNEEMRTRQLAAQNVFRETNSWAAFGYRSRRIVINTSKVSLVDAPKSLVELTNEMWRAKVALAFPQFGTTATHFHALKQLWGEERWLAWCRSLAANKPFIVDGNSVVVKQVARGEAWIGLTDSDDIFAGQREGLPIAALPLIEESLLIPNSVAVIRNAPHPANAQVLFGYLQQREVTDKLVQANALENATYGTDGTTMKPDWDTLLRDLKTTTKQLNEIFLR